MAKAIARFAPIIIGGLAFTAYVLWEIENPPKQIADIPSAPAMESAQTDEPLAYCAMAVTQARRAGYLPASSVMSPATPKPLTGAAGLASCIANAGDQYFQITYDKICDQAFEPGCARLVGVVAAGDGKILYVSPENPGEASKK